MTFIKKLLDDKKGSKIFFLANIQCEIKQNPANVITSNIILLNPNNEKLIIGLKNKICLILSVRSGTKYLFG